MLQTSFQQRRHWESLDRAALEQYQLGRLNQLLDEILPRNRFYAEKLAPLHAPLACLRQLDQLPFTLKQELAAADSHDLAANRTFPLERYVRFHRTSGTRGRPLAIVDTAADWQWWIDTWQYVLDAAAVQADDRAMMAFSFGPFIGFWSAHDAASARGAMVIPGGGMNTLGRLELISASRATVLFCTPSYALHLAETAQQHQLDVAAGTVRKIVVAGEPGGSVPAIRQRIESAWQARLTDHSGATEVGPWGYSDPQQRGLHVAESEFIAEFRSLQTGQPAQEGELSELVITSLGRVGCPVIRYRTGDVVRPSWPRQGPNRFVLLDGGVLGRVDDMMIIRGVNVFPSAVEQILRGFPELGEYRLIASRQGAMDALAIEVEDPQQDPARVAQQVQLLLGLRVAVRSVPCGSLPRFEGKGKRFIDQR